MNRRVLPTVTRPLRQISAVPVLFLMRPARAVVVGAEVVVVAVDRAPRRLVKATGLFCNQNPLQRVATSVVLRETARAVGASTQKCPTERIALMRLRDAILRLAFLNFRI
jgi:hypothetical protein